jgi:hypothetical protein
MQLFLTLNKIYVIYGGMDLQYFTPLLVLGFTSLIVIYTHTNSKDGL